LELQAYWFSFGKIILFLYVKYAFYKIYSTF